MFYYKDMEFETHGVYEPAEDSLLLAKVIESLNLESKDFLDMGCGSGLQGIIAASKGANVLSVDINPDAVKITRHNAEINGVQINVRRSDLFGSVRGKFDYIVFNAPYLPVEESLPQKETWAGGEKLEIVERFLNGAGKHLKENGIIFLLISSASDPDNVKEMAKQAGYSTEIAAREKIPWETLYVLEAKKDAIRTL